MAKKEFLIKLFEIHLADLQEVLNTPEREIQCPICLKKLSLGDIDSSQLSDGHVWPSYIRDISGSRETLNHRVLLCKSCNSSAGTRGDKQMQVLERVKRGKTTGELYGERWVEIVLGPHEKPIRLNSQISFNPNDRSKVSFKSPGSRNNPSEQGKFIKLAKLNEPFSMVVHPFSELNPTLAQVGWITSAYLFAFYTLGYRYILHPALDPVRSYILASFGEGNTLDSEVELISQFGVEERDRFEQPYLKDPIVHLMLPLSDFVHLQVSFLNYNIKLPFHFVPEVLEVIVNENLPHDRLSNLLNDPDQAKRLYLSTQIHGNKQNGLSAIWDYMLGKPL